MHRKFRPRRPGHGTIVAYLALFLALGGGALAATSFVGAGGRIRGCVSKKGKLVLIKPGARCREGSPIAWNQKGRPGNHGAPGPRGPSNGYTAIASESTSSAEASVNVPPGDYIASGGCTASQVDGTKNGAAESKLAADNDPAHTQNADAAVPFNGDSLSAAFVVGQITLANHSGFHLPNGGTISEACYDEASSDVKGMFYDNTVVTAVRVASLSG